MAELSVEAGKGLTVNEDGELEVLIDLEKSGDLVSSENGVWAKGLKSLSEQFVDEWTVTSNHKAEDEVEKNIWLNSRVITRCYTFCFLKSKRPFTGSANYGSETGLNAKGALYTIDPNDAFNGSNNKVNGETVSTWDESNNDGKHKSDLKDVLDIIREVNFPIIYSLNGKDSEYEPPVILRPGTLIAFTDVIYSTDAGAKHHYESGMRSPKVTTYHGETKHDTSSSETTNITEITSQPQHIYALFMVTKSNYSSKLATEDSRVQPASGNTMQANPAPYHLLEELKMRCIWSDTEAFHGLLNTQGWRQGEYLRQYYLGDKKYSMNNWYSREDLKVAETRDYGRFEQAVTYQDWPYVYWAFGGAD